MQETLVQFLGQEDPLDKEMATHSSNSCLENPMDRGAWQATLHGVTRVGHDLATEHARKYWIEMTGHSVEMGSASLWDGYG